MTTRMKWCFVLLALPALAVCRKTGPKMYDASPEIVTGKIYWEDPHPRPVEEQTIYEITRLMNVVMAMVDRKDLRSLPEYVSKEKGLYVDLKAHRTYKDLLKEVEKEDGYLQNFYLNTEALRKSTSNPSQNSVRDILRTTRKLQADFYMEGGSRECELKLHLLDNPEWSYMLNNPVFIKEGDQWKIYRLF